MTLKQIVRWLKIESLARKLDPKAFSDGRSLAKRRAIDRAKEIFAAAEGHYDAIGGKP